MTRTPLLHRVLTLMLSGFIVLSLAQCQGQSGQVITGRITLHEGWKPVIYLVQPRHFNEIAADYLGLVVDSADISEDGTFHLNLPEEKDASALYQFVVQRTESEYPTHLLDENHDDANYIPIFLQPGLIIAGDISSLQSSFVISSPSAENQKIKSLINLRRHAWQQFIEPLGIPDEHDTLILEREKALFHFQSALMHFADTTSSNIAALLATRWISPTNDFERIPEFLTRQCVRWKSASSSLSVFNQEMCTLARPQDLPVQTGDIMPDYSLPMHDGDTLMLRDMLGKKLTLVDLWASWCAPCRKENREILAPLWTKYKSAGFNIVGYSLDASADAWSAAITKDHADWLQSSHLQGDTAPFLEALRITTIPANYLLDEKGVILAKNLHGEELSKFVESYFQ